MKICVSLVKCNQTWEKKRWLKVEGTALLPDGRKRVTKRNSSSFRSIPSRGKWPSAVSVSQLWTNSHLHTKCFFQVKRCAALAHEMSPGFNPSSCNIRVFTHWQNCVYTMKFCAFYWRKAFEKVLEINSVSDGFVIESTVKRKQKGSDAILAKRKKKKKEFLSGRIIIASCLLLLLLFLFSFSRSPGSQLWRKRLPPGALCLGTSNSRNCNCWPLTARISRFFLFLRTSFPTLFFLFHVDVCSRHRWFTAQQHITHPSFQNIIACAG